MHDALQDEDLLFWDAGPPQLALDDPHHRLTSQDRPSENVYGMSPADTFQDNVGLGLDAKGAKESGDLLLIVTPVSGHATRLLTA